MVLNYKKVITIIPASPFHFNGTFYKPSHFPNKLKLEDWQPGKYWQPLRVRKRLYAFKAENKGILGKPEIKVTLYSPKKITDEEKESLKQEVIWRFELNVDLKDFNKLARKEKRFYPVFKKWLGMRNTSEYTLYELLIIAIVLQNATVRRSQQMLDVLIAKFGTKVRFDNKELWAIWLPERLNSVSEQELRDLKIGYRAKFIKRLSQNFAEGGIDEFKLRDLDKESAKKELLKLYGVGPETVRILLFEAFHHYDTFDHIAPWQQKIYSRLFYSKSSVSIEKIQADIKKKYGEYAMLAVHYIWEDIFWRRKNEKIEWLEKEIRL